MDQRTIKLRKLANLECFALFHTKHGDPSKFVEDQTDGRQLFTIIRQPFHAAEVKN